MAEYAKVIVDISQEKLDKTFEYRIPPYLTQRIAVGMQVYIPFGSRRITGYVVELSDEAEYDEDKLKNIAGIVTDSVPIESHLIALAGWMQEHYGGTMNQALKMVLPIKEEKKPWNIKGCGLRFIRWRRRTSWERMRDATAPPAPGCFVRCWKRRSWTGILSHTSLGCREV